MDFLGQTTISSTCVVKMSKSRDTFYLSTSKRSYGASIAVFSEEEEEDENDEAKEDLGVSKNKNSKFKKRKLVETKADLLSSCLNMLKTLSRERVNHFALHIASKLMVYRDKGEFWQKKGSMMYYLKKLRKWPLLDCLHVTIKGSPQLLHQLLDYLL